MDLHRDLKKETGTFLDFKDRIHFDRTSTEHYETKAMSTLKPSECGTYSMDNNGKYKGCPYTGSASKQCKRLCGLQWKKWLAPFVVSLVDDYRNVELPQFSIRFETAIYEDRPKLICKISLENKGYININRYNNDIDENKSFDLTNDYPYPHENLVPEIQSNIAPFIESKSREGPLNIILTYRDVNARDQFFKYIHRLEILPLRALLATIPKNTETNDEPDTTILNDTTSPMSSTSQPSFSSEIDINTPSHWLNLQHTRVPPLKRSKMNDLE